MYAKAGPFSLALTMLVRDQVLRLPSELKERSHEQESTERANRSCKIVDMFGLNSTSQWLTACCELSICLASQLLFFIFQRINFRKMKKQNIPFILTVNESLFWKCSVSLPLVQIGVVREFSKTLFYFCYNSTVS